MPLKNISKEPVKARYNGIEITTDPGKSLDVRDFKINSEIINDVERFILDKYGRGSLQLTASVEKNLEKEIAELKKENAGLLEQLNSAKDIIEKLESQIATRKNPSK